MIHDHHRKRRPHCSPVEYDHPVNILPLEDEVHELVHRNTGLAYKHGLLIRSWMSLDEAPEPDVNGFLAALGRTPVGTGSVQGGEEPMQTTVDGEEIPHSHVVTANGVEKQCPKCKGKGKVVEQEKPKDAEPAPERKKVTWSVRVPKDERENGYELLESLMDSSVDRMVELRMIRDKNKGANYYTLIFALRKFVLGELD